MYLSIIGIGSSQHFFEEVISIGRLAAIFTLGKFFPANKILPRFIAINLHDVDEHRVQRETFPWDF